MSISRLEATLNNTQQNCFYIFHRLDLGKCYLFKQLLNNTKVKWKSRVKQGTNPNGWCPAAVFCCKKLHFLACLGLHHIEHVVAEFFHTVHKVDIESAEVVVVCASTDLNQVVVA